MNQLRPTNQVRAQLRQELFKRKCLNSLALFTKALWPVIEPSVEYVHGWHIDAICDHLEACARYDIKRLLINMPPRHMKSILVNVMFPAWVWAHPEWAGRRIISGSYARDLAIRDGLKMRNVIESALYQGLFQPDWTLRDDQNQKLKFENTKSGFRLSTSVEGQVTGEGGDILIVDDPLNAQEANSQAARDGAIWWLDKVLASRTNDPKRYCKIVVMQRLHEDDPSGHIIRNTSLHGSYDRLILPARFESANKNKSATRLGFFDPRKTERSLLWPERFDDSSIKELENALQDQAHAQLQQDPKPASGALFRRSWWNRYHKWPANIFETIQFWDCAQKPGISNDYSVCATWARASEGYFLLDLWRGKVEAPFLEAIAVRKYELFKPDAVVVEDKSAGSSLIQYLHRFQAFPIPVIGYQPKGDKEVRATAATPTVQAGKCFLPETPIYVEDESGNQIELIEVFLNEHERFPKAAHDDIVDTSSMMVDWFAKRIALNPRIRSL